MTATAGVQQAQAQIARTNSDIQRRLGLYNEDAMRQINQFNSMLNSDGARAAGAVAAAALVALVAGWAISTCVPGADAEPSSQSSGSN